MHGMIFEYQSTSGTILNTTNAAMGQVILATSYDPTQTNYSTIQEILNNEFTTEAKPGDNCIHFIECKPSLTN